MAITTLLLVLLAQPPSAEDAGRQERLQYMQERGAEFALYRQGSQEPLSLKPEAVVRYSNPERDSGTWDGTTFLWLDGVRPAAAISFGIRRPNDSVFREMTSFSEKPLACSKGNAVVWEPQSGGLPFRPLPDAPPPATNAASRLTQMRTLARRFSASCTFKEDTSQLRLLTQPLYRYADDKQELLDGALFALVVSNDPEMFLLLEARPGEGDKPQWHYALARMSSLKQTVSLDGKEIWSVPGFYTIPAPERRPGPYVEAYQGKFVSALPSPE